MSKGRFGYELTPITVEGLLNSSLGQVEAMQRPDYTGRDGVQMTARAFADLCARLIQCERMLAAVRDELAVD